MATTGGQARGDLRVEPRFRGHFVNRTWYCDCLLEAKCRQITKEGSEFLGKKCTSSHILALHIVLIICAVWSCPKVARTEQCGMFTLDEDARKAKDWLAQYGPEQPDPEKLQKSKRERPPSPRTPPAKRNMNDNPFTKAKAKGKRSLPQESSDEWLDIRAADNGEGRAPQEVTTYVDEDAAPISSSSSRQDESDPPPAKRSRHSPTTPVPDAPRKKNTHVAFNLPTDQPDSTIRNLNRAFEAARRSEKRRDPISPPPPAPANSLPTPETGRRVKDFRIYEDKEDTSSRLRVDDITASQLAQLNSPINLDDAGSEASSDPTTPTKRGKTRRVTRSSTATSSEKGKEKVTAQDNESSQKLIKSIMAILRSEGHVLKTSTRYQIEHEIESVMDVKDARIRSCEKTIERLKDEVDQFEETIEHLTNGATVNGVIELSD